MLQCAKRWASTMAAMFCMAYAVYAAEPVHGTSWRWADFSSLCPSASRECSASLYAGKFNDTNMALATGIDGFIPPWKWTYADSQFIGGTFGRNIYHFGRYARIEAEIGAGQRFGLATAAEIWSALYVRWTAFPWNDYLRTSVAVSTGLSYATHIDEFERIQSTSNPEGSRLLHFFSPELTLGLPQFPNVDFLLRWHHRSGGAMITDIDMFNGVGDGANYLVGGIRIYF